MSTSPLRPLPGLRLWRIDLDAQPSPGAVAALSDAEWERARRFVFARDRQRFIAAHAALRETLGAATGLPAALLDFRLGAFGKPALVEPAGRQFNLSHSQSVGLIGVADADQANEIGVDVELLRPMPDAQELARHYFSPGEREALCALPAGEQERAFLVCWTRKEACLKAAGMGLGVDTRSFDVGIEPDARDLTIQTADAAHHMALRSIDEIPGALCAVAQMLASEDTRQARRQTTPRETFA